MKRIAALIFFLATSTAIAQDYKSSGIDVFQGKLFAIEQLVQQQTNTIERLNHRIEQLEKQVQNMNTDLDVRFDELKREPEKNVSLEKQEISPEISSPKEMYDTAMELMKAGNYAKAGKLFEEFTTLNPNHELTSNAYYWLGESYYVQGNYTRAAIVFAEGFQKFPKGAKASDNLLKLGLSMQSLNKKNEACTAFLELIKKNPPPPDSILNKAKAESSKLSCK